MRLVFNPLSGKFDFVGDSGGSFSLKVIAADEEIEIPENQQMLFHGDLMVEGNLMVSGEAFQVRQSEPESTFWTTVPVNKTIKIRQNRVLFYGTNFMVNGNLRVEGELIPLLNFFQ